MAETQVNVTLNAKVTGTGDIAKLRQDIRSAKQEAAAVGGRGAPAFQGTGGKGGAASDIGKSAQSAALGGLRSALSGGGIADAFGEQMKSVALDSVKSVLGGGSLALGAAGVAAAALAGAFINLSVSMDAANDMAQFSIDQGKKELDAKKALLDVQVKYDVGLAKSGVSLRNLAANLEDISREATRTANFREAGSSVFFNDTEGRKTEAANARDIAVAKANAEKEAQKQSVYDLMKTGRYSAPLAARKLAEIEQENERRTYSANRAASIDSAKAQLEQDTKALAVAKERAKTEREIADARIAAIDKQIASAGGLYEKRTGINVAGMSLTDLPEFQRRQGFHGAMGELKAKTASELPSIRDVNWTNLFSQFKAGDDDNGFAATVGGMFGSGGALNNISADNQERIRAWITQNKALLQAVATNQENDKLLTDLVANLKAREDEVLKRDAAGTQLNNALAAQQRRVSASSAGLTVAQTSALNPAQTPLPFVAPPRPDVNLGGRGRFGLFVDGIQSNMHNFASETAKNTGRTVALLTQLVNNRHTGEYQGT